MQNKEIIFQNWGLVAYNEAWQRQETLFNEIVERKKNHAPTSNYVVFCEHSHVYTLGKSGDERNLLINKNLLQAKNAEFVRTNRGGDITYHGQGQVVGYPILDLENFGIGVKQYIFLIENIIIELLSSYDIKADRLAGAAGVWLDTGTVNARKICAIGVRSSHFVTMHGFALNVNTDLSYFNIINPCGFADKGVTSIQKELNQQIDIQDVIEKIKMLFIEKFKVT